MGEKTNSSKEYEIRKCNENEMKIMTKRETERFYIIFCEMFYCISTHNHSPLILCLFVFWVQI